MAYPQFTQLAYHLGLIVCRVDIAYFQGAAGNQQSVKDDAAAATAAQGNDIGGVGGFIRQPDHWAYASACHDSDRFPGPKL
ncbi:hypothetical protein D3C84_1216910 [compost metagenome]